MSKLIFLAFKHELKKYECNGMFQNLTNKPLYEGEIIIFMPFIDQ